MCNILKEGEWEVPTLLFLEKFLKEAIILAKGRKATDIVEEIVKPIDN